ncbi:MAG TPA: nicotinate-nucleotide--dimethylbenzimidazole phosphoribosyltransferase [Acidimicrobiales bacterium]|nr:nicotinate-nucleotide--dimethylbenzimidazole phosphoribosyltransferase [Acidimicrobiales bacterium]
MTPTGGQFSPSERDVLRRVIESRRDVRRRFTDRPVPDEVLERILAAAHRAPSVGLSQPWDFLVITDPDTRRRVRAYVEQERARFADVLPAGRSRQFDRLKVEAIVEAPVSIVVTSTLERGGANVLGRQLQPETAVFSTCLAIENLWLTARAEGLGVGWVSFYRPGELSGLLGLPAHVTPVAYLCVGFVEDFDAEPELALAGWARPRPLSWAVHRETWANRSARPLEEALQSVGELDAAAMEAAAEHHDRLTKPRGSLGELETVGVRLAGIAGTSPPPIPEPATVAVFAGDHGVVRSGVTPWPAEVTRQMVANFTAGGAAINVLARQCGAEVIVVDVGVAGDLEAVPKLLRRKVRAGTADLRVGPAMTVAEAAAALDVGAEVARELVSSGARCLVTGDMGIGSTTASAALIARLTGRSASEVTGRGTGIDDAMLRHKTAVIDEALARTAALPDAGDPVVTLASLGGLEIAALAGYMIGGAAARVPVVVDGVIAAAALLVAAGIEARVVDYCFAGHLSVEPGAAVALGQLGLRPLLDLDLRLGEGTGACLALPILQSAARVLREMATFDQAGVTDKDA